MDNQSRAGLREWAERGLAAARWRYNQFEAIFGTVAADTVIPGWHKTPKDPRATSREIGEMIGWITPTGQGPAKIEELDMTYVFEIIKRGVAERELIAACLSLELLDRENPSIGAIEGIIEKDGDLKADQVRKTLHGVIVEKETALENEKIRVILGRMQEVKEGMVALLKESTAQEIPPELMTLLQGLGKDLASSLQNLEKLYEKKDPVALFLLVQFLTGVVDENEGIELWLDGKFGERGRVPPLKKLRGL